MNLYELALKNKDEEIPQRFLQKSKKLMDAISLLQSEVMDNASCPFFITREQIEFNTAKREFLAYVEEK